MSTSDSAFHGTHPARTTVISIERAPHQRVVYDIVRDHGPLGPSEIHDHYTEAVDDPRTKRTVRTYLSKIGQYNFLEAEGTSRD